MPTLSANNLYDLNDDQVQAQVRNAFQAQLQNGPSVHGTFFGSIGRPASQPADANWVDRVSSALVCSSISRSSLFGFSDTVNQSAADGYWQNQLGLSSPGAVQASRSLYDWAFPAYCQADGATFHDYLTSNPVSWAQQLAEKVTSASFINTDVLELLGGDANWLAKLNLVFYKLGRLDNSRVAEVVAAWTRAYPDKGITVQWQTYNFVPQSIFQADEFLSQVNAAINVTTGYDVPRMKQPPVPHEVHGAQVWGFINGTPNRLGLATGRNPSNDSIVQPSIGGGGGCFVAGTPVLLVGGETVPIEEVREGHEVLARDGAVSTHTDERVVLELQADASVFGINDDEPFFSAGHLFWTRGGWKALAPEIALEENPSISVGKLQEGDVVFRVRGVAPFTYAEVTIDRFTSRALRSGEKLYGLHLHGPRSYHANGYCVGMNYPSITEKRLFNGFARLSPWERRLIARQLEPVMPLLAKAIGPFIEGPVQRALIRSHPDAVS